MNLIKSIGNDQAFQVLLMVREHPVTGQAYGMLNHGKQGSSPLLTHQNMPLGPRRPTVPCCGISVGQMVLFECTAIQVIGSHYAITNLKIQVLKCSEIRINLCVIDAQIGLNFRAIWIFRLVFLSW